MKEKKKKVERENTHEVKQKIKESPKRLRPRNEMAEDRS